MRVILLKDVPSLGRSGAIVDVKEGYARNYLVPRGLAREATVGAVRARDLEAQAERDRRQREEREAAQRADALRGLVLEVRARAGAEGRLFGAITTQDLAEALAARGFPVDRKQIELKQPIRVEGFHTVAVRLPGGRLTQVDVNVVGVRKQARPTGTSPEGDKA